MRSTNDIKNEVFLKTIEKTLIFLLLILNSKPSEGRILEKIQAIVNGEIITLTEIKEYKNKLKTGGFLDELLFSESEVRKKALKNTEYLIKLLIDERIIDFEVKRQNFLVTEKKVNKKILTIAKKQNMTLAQLKKTFKTQSISYKDFYSFVKKSLERRFLVEKEITSKIKISEQDIISDYLSNNPSNGSQVFEYSLAHILLKKEDEKKAAKILKELNSGASFESLALKYSIDVDNRKQGGDFGNFKSGEMITSIEKAIENLKIGETSSVVKTPMGLHIFKVSDKKLVKDPAIEKQRQEIFQRLYARAFKEQLNFWLSQKRKEAIIQINKVNPI